MTIDDVLGRLINIDLEFAEELQEIHGDTCMICGFPFSKKIRLNAIKEAKLALLEIIKGVKPQKETSYFTRATSKSRKLADMIGGSMLDGFNQGADEYEKAIEEMFK